jgi:hypothetical protein
MVIPIRFGMKRKMFSRVCCFAASVGRTVAPLPFARLRTAAMLRKWWFLLRCAPSLCFPSSLQLALGSSLWMWPTAAYRA